MDLDGLFQPASVALIGASHPGKGKLASKPLEYLDRYGFAGAVYPVNPNYESLGTGGRTCYPSIARLPETPDVALLMVPYAQAIAQLRSCAEGGVRFVVMVSAPPSGVPAESLAPTLAAIRADGLSTRLIGPNTNGVLNAANALTLGWAPFLETRPPFPGPVGIVAQSGSMVSSMVERLRVNDIGVGKAVSTGAEGDLGLADFVSYLAHDDETQVIALFIESLRKAQPFFDSVRAARDAGKHVVAITVGRSDAAAAAAGAHTGAIVGNSELLSAALRENNVIEVTSLRELCAVVRLLVKPTRRIGRRTGLMTISGGYGAMLADEAHANGMEMPPLSSQAARQIADNLRMVTPANPCDFTGEVSDRPELADVILDAFHSDAGFETFVLGLGLTPAHVSRQLGAAFAAAAGRDDRLHVVLAPAGHLQGQEQALLEQAGVPVFTEASDLFRAVGSILSASGARPAADGESATSHPAAPTSAWQALPSLAGADEYQVKRFLADVGLPVPASEIAGSWTDCAAAADRLGFPVALKGLAPGITHKTEHGLVHLPVPDARQLREAYDALVARLETVGGGRVLVERLVGTDVELLASAIRDDVLGSAVVVGAGGVLTELVADAQLVRTPLTRQKVRESLVRLRCWPLLRGYRGRPGVDLEQLVDAVLAIGDIAARLPAQITAIEINPLAFSAADRQFHALDAVVTGVQASPGTKPARED